VVAGVGPLTTGTSSGLVGVKVRLRPNRPSGRLKWRRWASPGYALAPRDPALQDRAEHLANLDLLRAAAVLAVYVGHLAQLFDLNQVGPLSFRLLAQGGVAIFFVHTSYVLMRTLGRLPEEDRALRFYVRRVFRIYPLSILVVSTVVLVGIPAFPTRGYQWPGWSDVISNLALVQNLTLTPSVLDPLWSLPYEVQMYLLLPLLFVGVTHPRGPAPILLWLLAVVLALVQEGTTATRLDLARYAPCFVAGVVAFARERRSTARFHWLGWPVVIALAFALRQLGLEVGWLGCLLLGTTVGRFRPVNVRWIRTSAAWIARYSYGIYLAHLIVFWIAFIRMASAPLAVRIGVCIGLSVLVPVLLYHAVEAPMIAWGVTLAGQRRSAQLTPSS